MSKILKLYRRKYKDNNRGFTLAELLVVVAIIAILVAVSIPIFTGKLNEARQNTDLANERAAKAAAIAEFLQSDQTSNYAGFYDAKSGRMITAENGEIPQGIEGYNQIGKINSGANSAIIYVSIVPQDDGEAPGMTLQWMLVKKPGQS